MNKIGIHQAGQRRLCLAAESLGDPQFVADYGIRYAYVVGAMYKGISSAPLVIALGRAGLIGYFGAGGLSLGKIELAISQIESVLSGSQRYGMNLLCNPDRPEVEAQTVDLYLRRAVRFVEAAAFVEITQSLVRYRLTGLAARPNGSVHAPNRVLAKVSRLEVASAFMKPAPPGVVASLLDQRLISREEASLADRVPMADEICVEADSGGHTDQGAAFALVPAIVRERDDMMQIRQYDKRIRVGAAGGIGTPQAAAAAFVMGADFILTGSINQCTQEAGTSADVKDLLQQVGIKDTAYAPAGDLFELGARVQVLKRGVFFPGRANHLFALYQQHGSWSEIDAQTRVRIEKNYFGRSFEEVWDETKRYYSQFNPRRIEECKTNPKQQLALVFRWYFVHTTRLAIKGVTEQRANYQIHCGPAMGAFNHWVKGTDLTSWRNRHVADVAERIMRGAAEVLNTRWQAFVANSSETSGVSHESAAGL